MVFLWIDKPAIEPPLSHERHGMSHTGPSPVSDRFFKIPNIACELRNRKHVLCFYRVIETRVEVWENEKCCGECFHSFFEFSQTFMSVSVTR